MDTITQEKAYEFYMLTNNTLTDMAEKRGIKKLNDYYELTDFNTCTEYGQLLNGLGKIRLLEFLFKWLFMHRMQHLFRK